MERFTPFTSRVVLLPVNNIDTDQIIPARFLKVTDKAGLGEHLFTDWRYLPDGTPRPDFVLNRAESRGAEILMAGDNFGCGSSREHAPWALTAYGFRAVISTSFADIFSNNALKNNLLPIRVSESESRELLDLLSKEGASPLGVDLEGQTVELPTGKKINFPIDSFAKSCLLNGVDELGYILRFNDAIRAYEQSHGGTRP
ncbi:MAG TPA: 3-isopropylmalate dehydratase small subunit [Bacteroidota bacterium]|nr:3-isopropylmalate dehydratase small subunit [Bacteroidota bacterium]